MPNKQRILVVEDEEHLAFGIKYNLEAENYEVTAVTDGPSALRLIEQNAEHYDLLILDLMLPGMSGYTVCESLRQAKIDLPVLILSARTLTEDRTRGFEVGADQYLTKPFDLDELLSRVKSLLAMYRLRKEQKTTPASLGVYEFGEASINFDTHEASCRGKSVRLTQLELALLRYFIENEGRVIPRQELLENVWEMPGYIHTRAPDQFLRRLRKAFEFDPSNPQHFLTIRDTGYRFVPNPDE